MSTIERPLPPLNADERITFESWLDFHRATLAMKCEGMGDEQGATTDMPIWSGNVSTALPAHSAAP